MNKKILFVSILAVVVVAGALAFYFVAQKNTVQQPTQQKRTEEKDSNVSAVGNTLGVQDIGQATDNPLQDMPSTNPLEDVANPFRDAYKNPFK